MNKEELCLLQEKAKKIRLLSLESIYLAKSGHPGGSLSMAEIISYLYFHEMKVTPENPKNPERDRFVLSKGHAAPALYSALALRGFFPTEELKSLRKVGSMLQGHPDSKKIPGVDISTGSLGQGLSTACGMALSANASISAGTNTSICAGSSTNISAGTNTGISAGTNAGSSTSKYNVYSVVGDGELQEGQIWEAVMLAAQYKLSNLYVFVDYNKVQLSGFVDDISSLGDIAEKFRVFGWFAQTVDGHNIEEIDKAMQIAKNTNAPCVIVCNTIKGKGVSFMENNCKWHGNAPNSEQYAAAVAEIEKA